MEPTFTSKQVLEPSEKAKICRSITKTLPEWFGKADANRFYFDHIGTKTVFAVFDGATPVGAVALKKHFSNSLEVWWLGVLRQWHRQGAGRLLIHAAQAHAEKRACSYLVLKTVGPDAQDPNYDLTRKFYLNSGFEPIIGFELPDDGCPMMWMVKKIKS